MICVLLAEPSAFRLNQINPSNEQEKNIALKEIFGVEDSTVIITPVYFDIGNISIGKHCFINHNCKFIDLGGIDIGNNVCISVACTFISDDHPGNPLLSEQWIDIPKRIVIGDNTWIGANVTVMPGVTIGKDCIIGANSLVTKDVPDGEVWCGTPAKYLKTTKECYNKK